ncbi:GntR family transcriptional regulator [Lacibacterium aquatile]|uniref:GntR family transcriptional regulator n=1 Tax=Lacibacterium aquatile TaxID=1168082 RepID=A0ABW5DL63_9PROT
MSRKLPTEIDALIAELKPDEASSTPLYIQLAENITDAIRAGRWLPGEALPPERVLAQSVAVSRVTTRKAVELLIDRGILTTRQGSGTFVARPMEHPATTLASFSEEIRARGMTPGSKWLSRELSIATPEEALSLGLAPGTAIARLSRLRLADDEVMAIEVSALPSRYLPDPTVLEDSLYSYMRGQGTAPVRALQHIRAVNATERQATLMGVKPGLALLYISRIAFLPGGSAVEFTRSYYRGDRYDLVSELSRGTEVRGAPAVDFAS